MTLCTFDHSLARLSYSWTNRKLGLKLIIEHHFVFRQQLFQGLLTREYRHAKLERFMFHKFFYGTAATLCPSVKLEAPKKIYTCHNIVCMYMHLALQFKIHDSSGFLT